MAFVIEMNIANVGTINSHAQAVAFYDKCRVGRTKEHGEERRIKGKERNKDMCVSTTRVTCCFATTAPTS